MGTNYYHHTNACEHCGRSDKRHIGKASGGWCFALHIYPHEGIRDLEDWRERWEDGVILNEYGDAVDVAEMLSIITERAMPDKPWAITDPYSEPGPHNLLRHRIGISCDAHGAGTWDLMEGDFS